MFSFYNRFTQRAQNALRLAHESSKEMGHSYVGSEHILLGLIARSGHCCKGATKCRRQY